MTTDMEMIAFDVAPLEAHERNGDEAITGAGDRGRALRHETSRHWCGGPGARNQRSALVRSTRG
jgi:hypothetical protein